MWVLFLEPETYQNPAGLDSLLSVSARRLDLPVIEEALWGARKHAGHIISSIRRVPIFSSSFSVKKQSTRSRSATPRSQATSHCCDTLDRFQPLPLCHRRLPLKLSAAHFFKSVPRQHAEIPQVKLRLRGHVWDAWSVRPEASDRAPSGG